MPAEKQCARTCPPKSHLSARATACLKLSGHIHVIGGVGSQHTKMRKEKKKVVRNEPRSTWPGLGLDDGGGPRCLGGHAYEVCCLLFGKF